MRGGVKAPHRPSVAPQCLMIVDTAPPSVVVPPGTASHAPAEPFTFAFEPRSAQHAEAVVQMGSAALLSAGTLARATGEARWSMAIS